MWDESRFHRPAEHHHRRAWSEVGHAYSLCGGRCPDSSRIACLASLWPICFLCSVLHNQCQKYETGGPTRARLHAAGMAHHLDAIRLSVERDTVCLTAILADGSDNVSQKISTNCFMSIPPRPRRRWLRHRPPQSCQSDVSALLSLLPPWAPPSGPRRSPPADVTVC